MPAMKVLLIGGTGNISSDCASLLHTQGHEVFILTRGKMPVPPAYRAVVADRKNIKSMRAAIATVKPDVAINFIGFEVADLELDFAVAGWPNPAIYFYQFHHRLQQAAGKVAHG